MMEHQVTPQSLGLKDQNQSILANNIMSSQDPDPFRSKKEITRTLYGKDGFSPEASQNVKYGYRRPPKD